MHCAGPAGRQEVRGTRTAWQCSEMRAWRRYQRLFGRCSCRCCTAFCQPIQSIYWPSRSAYSVLNWVFMGSSLSNSSMKSAKECRGSASEEVDLHDVVNRFETWSPNWKGYILSYWNAFVRSCLWILVSWGRTLDSWIMKMFMTTFFQTFRFECYYRNSCVVLLLS